MLFTSSPPPSGCPGVGSQQLRVNFLFYLDISRNNMENLHRIECDQQIRRRPGENDGDLSCFHLDCERPIYNMAYAAVSLRATELMLADTYWWASKRMFVVSLSLSSSHLSR